MQGALCSATCRSVTWHPHVRLQDQTENQSHHNGKECQRGRSQEPDSLLSESIGQKEPNCRQSAQPVPAPTRDLRGVGEGPCSNDKRKNPIQGTSTPSKPRPACKRR